MVGAFGCSRAAKAGSDAASRGLRSGEAPEQIWVRDGLSELLALSAWPPELLRLVGAEDGGTG